MKIGRTKSWILGCTAWLAVLPGATLARDLPQLRRNGEATQLIVDGLPYLALAGELHNSSASSPQYMAPVWDKLARNGVRTVLGTASWELVEPEEGRFDFATVDDQIKQARAHGLRLVMIWFGAYKNAESTYAPSWVRRNEARFPRGLRDPNAKPSGIGAYLKGPIVSVFSDRLVAADARAFAALMRHIRETDRDGTVIMMQVENEVGILGSPRDHSPLANAAWTQQVPSDLLRYLRQNRAALRPELAALWARQGNRTSGTWAEVFGTDAAAQEIFMAWGFGRYVDRVAKAGAAEHPLPMFANAWLGPQPNALVPGDYPSGGPVARMMDVWKAAAPSLVLLAPDIYIDDFAGTLADFRRADNPIFIPEARLNAGNLFVALGRFNALGFSPFGIEDAPDGHDVFKAYAVLGGMTAQIVAAQAEGRIRGFKLTGAEGHKERLGGYDVTISRGMSTVGVFGPGTGAAGPDKTEGYGLLIQVAEEEFLAVGRGISLKFAVPGKEVEVDSAQEGVFEKGQWVPGRTLNGDERFALFPNDDLRIVRIRLLRR